VLDNLRRKPMSLEGYLDHPETVAAPDRFGHRLNVSMPLRPLVAYLRRRDHVIPADDFDALAYDKETPFIP
jgi:hypothetical protein